MTRRHSRKIRRGGAKADRVVPNGFVALKIRIFELMKGYTAEEREEIAKIAEGLRKKGYTNDEVVIFFKDQNKKIEDDKIKPKDRVPTIKAAADAMPDKNENDDGLNANNTNYGKPSVIGKHGKVSNLGIGLTNKQIINMETRKNQKKWLKNKNVPGSSSSEEKNSLESGFEPQGAESNEDWDAVRNGPRKGNFGTLKNVPGKNSSGETNSLESGVDPKEVNSNEDWNAVRNGPRKGNFGPMHNVPGKNSSGETNSLESGFEPKEVNSNEDWNAVRNGPRKGNFGPMHNVPGASSSGEKNSLESGFEPQGAESNEDWDAVRNGPRKGNFGPMHNVPGNSSSGEKNSLESGVNPKSPDSNNEWNAARNGPRSDCEFEPIDFIQQKQNKVAKNFLALYGTYCIDNDKQTEIVYNPVGFLLHLSDSKLHTKGEGAMYLLLTEFAKQFNDILTSTKYTDDDSKLIQIIALREIIVRTIIHSTANFAVACNETTPNDMILKNEFNGTLSADAVKAHYFPETKDACDVLKRYIWPLFTDDAVNTFVGKLGIKKIEVEVLENRAYSSVLESFLLQEQTILSKDVSSELLQIFTSARSQAVLEHFKDPIKDLATDASQLLWPDILYSTSIAPVRFTRLEELAQYINTKFNGTVAPPVDPLSSLLGMGKPNVRNIAPPFTENNARRAEELYEGNDEI